LNELIVAIIFHELVVFFVNNISSVYGVLICHPCFRSWRKRERRRLRSPMRGGSSWPSCVLRRRRLQMKRLVLSWRYLLRSSTEACAFVLYQFCGASAAVFYSSLVCDSTMVNHVICIWSYLRIF
jgi:hypothetical protein